MTTIDVNRPQAAEQLTCLASRAIRSATRSPAALVLPLVFPLVILAINVRALEPAALLDGFPTNNIASFAIALAFLQGALFSAVLVATALASDLESGFLDRIAVTPTSAASLVLARLTSVAVLAVAHGVLFAGAGVLLGANLETGWTGWLVLAGLVLAFNLAAAGVAFLFALGTRSSQATQVLFPLFFVVLMMSSALMPRSLMSVDWYRTLADLNPISYLVESIRSLYVDGWDWSALLIGGGIGVVVSVGTFVGAAVYLRALMGRG